MMKKVKIIELLKKYIDHNIRMNDIQIVPNFFTFEGLTENLHYQNLPRHASKKRLPEKKVDVHRQTLNSELMTPKKDTKKSKKLISSTYEDYKENLTEKKLNKTLMTPNYQTQSIEKKTSKPDILEILRNTNVRKFEQPKKPTKINYMHYNYNILNIIYIE